MIPESLKFSHWLSQVTHLFLRPFIWVISPFITIGSGPTFVDVYVQLGFATPLGCFGPKSPKTHSEQSVKLIHGDVLPTVGSNITWKTQRSPIDMKKFMFCLKGFTLSSQLILLDFLTFSSINVCSLPNRHDEVKNKTSTWATESTLGVVTPRVLRCRWEQDVISFCKSK